MTFDIIEMSDEDIERLSNVQMQLLRTAQKKKNELYHKMEKDIALYKKLVLTNNFIDSSIGLQKETEIRLEYEYQVDILREQLQYSLEINDPYPNEDEDQELVGYVVDYSLPYIDRYAIVKEYYLSILDPAERMNLYAKDDVARRYLDNYYTILYNVLYTYSK